MSGPSVDTPSKLSLEPSSKLSLGIGLTNACNLECAHCYRPRGEPAFLGVDDVVRCLEVFGNVGSVNLGTGENILNPALGDVLDELSRRNVRTSLTSNGLSLLQLDEDRLSRLHDVEVSFDFATEAEHDAFRGKDAFATAVRALQRCVDLGLEVTMLAVLMSINHDRLAAIAKLAASLGASFRVNVYQPVHGRELMPSWEQFWEGFELLFAETALVTCTESVVGAVLDTGENSGGEEQRSERNRHTGCGRSSVRLTPTGELLPCVYWPKAAAQLRDLNPGDGDKVLACGEFERCRILPPACRDCPLEPRCGGGCAARRALTVGVDQPDPFCPLAGGEAKRIKARPGAALELLHASNVCTSIVRAE